MRAPVGVPGGAWAVERGSAFALDWQASPGGLSVKWSRLDGACGVLRRQPLTRVGRRRTALVEGLLVEEGRIGLLLKEWETRPIGQLDSLDQ